MVGLGWFQWSWFDYCLFAGWWVGKSVFYLSFIVFPENLQHADLRRLYHQYFTIVDWYIIFRVDDSQIIRRIP